MFSVILFFVLKDLYSISDCISEYELLLASYLLDAWIYNGCPLKISHLQSHFFFIPSLKCSLLPCHKIENLLASFVESRVSHASQKNLTATLSLTITISFIHPYTINNNHIPKQLNIIEDIQ